MKWQQDYTIFSLGDTALIVDFKPVINVEINKQVLQLFHFLKDLSLPYVIDIIPAYSSISVFYDLWAVKHQAKDQTAFEFVAEKLQEIMNKEVERVDAAQRHIQIPVCYEFAYAPDLIEVAKQTGLGEKEVVEMHLAKQYHVYMIGFLPGFAYMGDIDEKIEVPRKSKPVQVPAGSVGITGKQTGIYPLSSPGGWQIIGRTPLDLFDASLAEPVLLQPGDIVQFFPINEHEFKNYKGRNI